MSVAPLSAEQKSSQLQAAASANHDIQVLAAGLGVPVGKLIRCLVGAIGIAKLIQCLRGGSDFFTCIGENVDWSKVVECALGAIPGSDGFE